MSKQPPQKPTAGQAVPPLTGSDVLLAIKENFVVLSAVAAVLGITLATTFFGAYLSVFDWRLLWYVQYTDVLTFGVIAIGIISGSLATLQGATHTFLGLRNSDQKNKRRWIIGICTVFVVITALNAWSAGRSGQPYWHIVFGAAVMGLGIFLILWAISLISARAWPTSLQCMMLVVSCILASVSFGQWLGFTVQETGKGQDVTVKDKELNNVRVIAILARHTILLQDENILVVPTADITQIKSSIDPLLKVLSK
jgi:MFS family permease